MQILTRLVIVCALAAIAPFSSRGADTDAQNKAREALRQKMSELDVQPVATNAAPPAAPTKAPKTKSTPAVTKPAPARTPVVTQPAPAPVVTEPAPAPRDTVRTVPPPPPPVRTVEQPETPAPPVVKTTKQPKPAPAMKNPQVAGQVTASRPDSDRIAKAREALEMKLQELNTQGGQPVASGETTPAGQPIPTRTREISSANQPVATTDSNETLPTPPPPKRSPETEVKRQKPNKPRETRPMPESRPMYALPQGPPPPVSADKVQKLNALLQQYQADQITPEQYHAERAKILAGQ